MRLPAVSLDNLLGRLTTSRAAEPVKVDRTVRKQSRAPTLFISDGINDAPATNDGPQSDWRPVIRARSRRKRLARSLRTPH